jgi:hypothetical protein
MSYIVSDFSFNIGGTNISQEYVKLFKPDVPWGINTTYIYKEDTLSEQFNINNKHLVIENKNIDGNIVFKTQGTGTGTGKIIINDLSVNSINGLPYTGSGTGGVSLTLNSVNSSHIQNGSITTSKIADNTITSEQLQSNCVTTSKIPNNTIIESQLQGNCVTETKIFNGAVTQSKLSTALLNRIAELEKLQGVIHIQNNAETFAQSYKLYYKNPTTNVLTQFAQFNDLGAGNNQFHYFKLPTTNTQIVYETIGEATIEGITLTGCSEISTSDTQLTISINANTTIPVLSVNITI